MCSSSMNVFTLFREADGVDYCQLLQKIRTLVRWSGWGFIVVWVSIFEYMQFYFNIEYTVLVRVWLLGWKAISMSGIWFKSDAHQTIEDYLYLNLHRSHDMLVLKRLIIVIKSLSWLKVISECRKPIHTIQSCILLSTRTWEMKKTVRRRPSGAGYQTIRALTIECFPYEIYLDIFWYHILYIHNQRRSKVAKNKALDGSPRTNSLVITSKTV